MAKGLRSVLKSVSRDSLHGGGVGSDAVPEPSEPHLPVLYLTGMKLEEDHLDHPRDMTFPISELQLHAPSDHLRPVTVLLV
jgi:hypothetical protein